MSKIHKNIPDNKNDDANVNIVSNYDPNLSLFQFNSWYKLLHRYSLKATVLHSVNYSHLLARFFSNQSISTETSELSLLNSTWNAFVEQIKHIAEEYGNGLFFKLNWSCPSDAEWITFNKQSYFEIDSYEISKVEQMCKDVLVLLKSSDKIMQNDFTLLTYLNQEIQLVVKKYYALDRQMEFRTFIAYNVETKEFELLGSEYILENKEQILYKTSAFCAKIMNVLTENNYFGRATTPALKDNCMDLFVVVDLYIIKNTFNIKIVDFGLFTSQTDLGLLNEDDITTSMNTTLAPIHCPVETNMNADKSHSLFRKFEIVGSKQQELENNDVLSASKANLMNGYPSIDLEILKSNKSDVLSFFTEHNKKPY